MIDRQGNKILIECDSCDEVFSGDEGEEWGDVWRRAKNDGWTTKSHPPLHGEKKGTWTHGCSRHEA